MAREFDPGYYRQPYRDSGQRLPERVGVSARFVSGRMGPVSSIAGGLDGSARILIIGQDPATHESIARRILVGEAGQRAQGLLTRLGIDRSYVFINTFLYSVYRAGRWHPTHRRPSDHEVSEPVDQRDRGDQQIEAIISLGAARGHRLSAVAGNPKGAANTATYATISHPTYPESASRSGQITKAEAFAKLCDSWNVLLQDASCDYP